MKTRLFLLASLTLLAALFFTGAVFAEGEVPPAPAEEQPAPSEAAAEEATPPDVQTPATEQPAAEPSADFPADEIPAEVPAAEAEELMEAPATEAAPTDEVLPEAEALTVLEAAPADESLPEADAPAVMEAAPESMIPEQTLSEETTAVIAKPEIVLVDAAGEALDMASQASAEALNGADPYFTVGLITYRFSEVSGYCDAFGGDAHCFDPDSIDPVVDAIQYAIDYIWDTLGEPPTDGNIYVQYSPTDYIQDVEIDAATHPVELSALKGLIGLADLTTGAFPTLAGNVSIIGVGGGFTLSGFTINGSVNFNGNIGTLTLTDLDVSKPAGGGIQITNQTGNVVMTNVRSSHNANTGADINNTLGGNVTITNSAFDYNGAGSTVYGLYIRTKGVVTINGISASHNYDSGIDVAEFSSLTLKNAVLNGSVSKRGLNTSTDKAAPVVLQNVTASYNGGEGLDIQTAGTISLNSVDTHENFSIGINLDNDAGTGTVTLTNIRTSNNNYDGLYVEARGAITLTSVSAFQNHGSYGAHLDNCRDLGSGCTGTGSVTVTSPASAGFAGVNSFWGNNPGYGLWIKSTGAVTITNVEVYSNLYDGLYISNNLGTAGVTINKNLANWTNGFWENGNRGIDLYTNGIVNLSSCTAQDNDDEGIAISGAGAITLTDVQAFHNGLGGSPRSGLSIDNTDGTGGVTIRSTVITDYMDFSGNTNFGIIINSQGAVSVNSVRANNNKFGLYIYNETNPTASPAVTVSNGEFNNNDFRGVVVVSKGAITLTNVSASGSLNGQNGVDLDNSTYGTSSGVTIRSSSSSVFYEFSKNTGSGIKISSKGAVSVSNVIAEGNYIDGIYILNNGAVSVGNITASDNKGFGLNIDRRFGAGAISVTRGTFDLNGLGGVQILSNLAVITLTDITASNNDTISDGAFYSGLLINSTWGGTPGGSVTVKSSTTARWFEYSNNGWYGIEIYAFGPILVSNVIAEGNTDTNIYLDNIYASNTSPKPISVTRSTANSSTNGYGFAIYSKGNVTLNTLTANENLSGFGLYVNAADGFVLIPAIVTLTGARNEFSANGLYGINIETDGNISLTNAMADENSGFGIYLDTSTYTDSTGNVTINASTNFWNSSSSNGDTGLYIYTYGTVNISRMHSNDNGNNGISIDNASASPLAKNVTLTSVDANRNRGEPGLYINSLGAVALNSTRADSNEQTGLRIYTNGAITFNGVSASYNSTHEADIPSANATIHERLTSDSEGDIWKFVGDNTINYTITLESKAFDAYLKLFYWNTVNEEWDFVSGDDSSYGAGSGIDDAQLTFPSGAGGLITGVNYYILATTSEDWGEPGDYVLNFNGPGTTPPYEYFGARIDNHTATANVTITSPANFWSVFNENNYTGLQILTNGAVSITNTDANNNDYCGIDIVGIPGPASVTIRNISATRLMEISDNEGYGIHVPGAFGAITISGRIYVNDNGDIGAFLRNSSALDTSPKSVTITSLTASDNEYAGIYVDSKGTVTLSSIIANNNQGDSYGVRIDNAYSPNSSVTINGSNIISDNKGNGLNINTNGTISISGVTAERNGGHGILLDSHGTGKTVSLKNITTLYNALNGLQLNVSGATTLDGIRSWLNGVGSNGDGLNINGNTGTTSITIKNSSFIGNEGNGIDLDFGGTYSLLTTFYFGNDTNNSLERDLYIH